MGSFVLIEASALTIIPIEPQATQDLLVRMVPTHISVVIVTLILVFLHLFDTHRAELQLAVANSQLEDLLDNMLPKSISNRLRQEGRTFADGYTMCTVLFADLVGFTTLSTQLPAEKLVGLLDDIFSRFDELTERHGLEKIKTIGDAYMVAAGIPVARPDHAHAAVRLAYDMRSVIKEYAGLKVRIGINSGPVVAGIIGRKRFIYDLWGDTVNVASRMESQGIAEGIQISEATRALIDDEFETESRGEIDLKGRGPMSVHLVIGRRLDQAQSLRDRYGIKSTSDA